MAGQQQAPLNVVHELVVVGSSSDRFQRLVECVEGSGSHVLVYCNSLVSAHSVLEPVAPTRRLERQGVRAALLTGSQTEGDVQATAREFSDGSLAVVVATDVGAKRAGLTDARHVINYELPYDVEQYVHRVGRAGQWHRPGLARVFCARDELGSLIVQDIMGLLPRDEPGREEERGESADSSED